MKGEQYKFTEVTWVEGVGVGGGRREGELLLFLPFASAPCELLEPSCVHEFLQHFIMKTMRHRELYTNTQMLST